MTDGRDKPMTKSKVNEPGLEAIMQVGLGFWASKTLLSAIEMEVFTELAGHAEDLNSLQGRFGLHPRSAHDFLDALVALGFLQRANGEYSNTPSTDNFSTNTSRHTLAACWRWQIAGSIRFGAISRPRSAPEKHRMKPRAVDQSLRGALRRSRRLKGFLKAMTGLSTGGTSAHCQQVSLEEIQNGSGRRHCPG